MQQLEDRRMLAVASQPAIALPTVDDPVAVGVGTFDNDAYNDAVILGSNGDLTIATGGPDDAWQTIGTTDTGLGPQQSLIAQRLSADPFTDLVTMSDDAVHVLHSDTAGGFTAVQTITAPASGAFANSVTNNTLTVDFVDGDPIRDLVAVANAGDSVLIYPGNAGGTFDAPTTYSTGVTSPTTAVVADVIGDDLPDLIVGHENGTLVFFEGVAAGSAQTLQRRDDLSLVESASITDLGVSDFDGDGNDDIVVTTTTDAFVLFSQDDPQSESLITNGNFSAALTGWETEIVGHAADATPGRVNALGGAAQLTENESFLTSLKQTIVIPADAQTLTFDLVALGLDPIAGGVPDAFEVSLLDASEQSLVATHHPDSTAFFNISSGANASLANGVSVSGSTVTLDVSALAAGMPATLVFDLIGNPAKDGTDGNGSVATIDNVTVTPDLILSDTLNRVVLTGAFGGLVALSTGDLDGDGNQDVVVVDQSTDTLTVFNGDGAGGFSDDPIALSGSGSGSSSIATGTLTAGDSADDIIVTLSGSDLALSPLGADVTSPIISLIDPVEDSNEPTFGGTITIEFSEAVRESGVGSVNNLAAYSLVGAGDDGVLGSSDDVVIAISGVTYDPTTLTAVLTVDSNALPFVDDDYQVTIDGTGPTNAVRDLVGNTVGGGSDVTFGFTVDAPLSLSGLVDPIADEGTQVTISANFDDPGQVGGYTAVINWGDGVTESAPVNLDASSFAGSISADHVYADDGIYIVELTLTDGDGEEVTRSVMSVISNADPTLSGLNDISATENTAATFTGLFTITDPGFTFGSTTETFDATIDWGDGTTPTTITDITGTAGATGPTIAEVSADHTFASEGVYTVTISVTDDDGGTATGTLQAFVSNTAPVLAPINAVTANEGDEVTVSGSYSDDDLGPGIDPATTHMLSIDWGDGTIQALTPAAGTGNEATFSANHTYADDGVYEIRVTVMDNDTGQASATADATITGITPSITAASNATTPVGANTTFALATFTDPGFTSASAGTEETFTATVDWGDGSAVEMVTGVTVTNGSPGVLTLGSVSAEHIYAAAGVFTVAVTITDDDGLSASTSLTIEATSDDPTGACLPHIDFDNGISGSTLPSGTVITDQWALWGVNVTTNDPVNHPAMIFDSSHPTGGDHDLGTPNHDFGGPGVGSGGVSGTAGENATSLGNILIISEDADSSDPDDNAAGGTLIFTFDNPVQLDEVGLLDIDNNETSTITLFDSADNVIDTVSVSGLGNNAVQTVAIDADNVARMEIDFPASGAVTDLVFCRDLPSVQITGDVSVNEGSQYNALLLSPDVAVTAWQVNWGDGTSDTVAGDSPTGQHTYADGPTDVTISGWATDGTNVYPATSLDVTVDNVDPALTIAGDADVEAFTEYTLDLASIDPGDDTIIQWTIDWGDGTTQVVNGNPDSVTHTYSAEGTYSVTATAFDEDNAQGGIGTDGLIVLEAEAFDVSHPGSGNAANSQWVTTSDSTASGDTYLLASPNSGVNTQDTTDGPRLDYAVNFSQSGTYYAWVRMLGASNSDDSVHLGLNGQPATYGHYGMTNNSGDWHWEQNVNNRSGVDRVTINVPAAGSQTVNLWMREDGTAVDKILFTTDPNFVPTDLGPDPIVTGDAYVSNTISVNVTPSSSVWLPNVDFNVDAAGTPLSAGDRITDQFASLGFTVTTHDPVNKPAMIFDSSHPTGHDDDLGTPNEHFGGPGWGNAGQTSNDTSLGNLLIISEDNNPHDPDDNHHGGSLIFTFDQPVMIDELGVIDIESTGNQVKLYDANDNLISTTDIAVNGSNGVSRVQLNALGVSRMEVILVESGAITDIEFCRDGAPIAPAQTRFFVVDRADKAAYRYGTTGTSLGDFDLSNHASPRGAATTGDGNPIWVIGSNKRVYVYDTDGETLLGSWRAKGIHSPEGIATDGTDIWIIDKSSDCVYHFPGAASRLSGSQWYSDGFQLAWGNRTPRGITTDGNTIWTVDTGTDKVFVYDMDGNFINWWRLDPQNTAPRGITINPSGGDGVWVVDKNDDAVYHYANATLSHLGTQNAVGTFDLAPGNNHPEGIADPVMMINLGDSVSDGISVAGEVDEWIFDTTAANTDVFVDFTALAGGSATVSITAPDGSSLFNRTSSFTGSLDSKRITLSQIGTHTITVTSTSTPTYAFTLNEVIDDPTQTINLGDVVSGAIDPVGQNDTFQFNASAGTQIYIDRLTTGPSALLQLTTPSGSNMFSSFTSFFVDSNGQVELPETGDYILTISYNSGDAFNYQFQINDVTTVPTQAVQLNEVISSTVDTAGQQLDFSFSTTGPTDIVLDAIANPSLRTWAITDSTGTQVYSDLIIRDSNKFSLAGPEDYTLSVLPLGDDTGPVEFVIWDSTDIGPVAADLNTDYALTIAPQQNATYQYNLVAGEQVLFDVQKNLGSIPAVGFSSAFTLTAPSGADVFTSVAVDQDVFTAPESGVYTLTIQSFNPGFKDLSGEIAWRLQQQIVPPASTTPDSVGSEFFLAAPDGFFASISPKLVIAAESDTQAIIDLPGIGWLHATDVAAGTTALVDLPTEILLERLDREATEFKGIHLVADAEVSVFLLLDGFQSSDAATGLPVDALGTEYLAETYPTTCALGCQPSQISIVATEDNTVVTITPSIDAGEASSQRLAGIPYDIFLNAGQTYKLQGGSFIGGPGFTPIGLSGTEIVSDKPIAVYGGNPETNVPDVKAADILVQQMPPVAAWGTRYASVPLAGRVGGDTFRVMAANDGTNVSINGSVVATLNRGEHYETILDTAAEFTADAPIMVTRFGHSGEFDSPGAAESDPTVTTGDPLMITLVPTEQFDTDFIVLSENEGINDHYLSITTFSSGVNDVTVDGVAVDPASFTPIGDGTYSGATLAVAAGTHVIASTTPASVEVYGYGNFDSYGYYAGTRISPVGRLSSLSLTPPTAALLPGNDHTVTAQVTDDAGQPLADVRVDFSVEPVGVGGNYTFATPTYAYSDAAGLVSFTYTSDAFGSDIVTASVGAVESTASVDWLGAPPTVTVISPSNGATVASDTDLVVNGLALSGPTGANIVAVSVNGQSVDVLDAAGNFFATVTPVDGVNTYEFIATDANGQTATQTLTLNASAIVSGFDLESAIDNSLAGTLDFAGSTFNRVTNVLHTEATLTATNALIPMATTVQITPSRGQITLPPGGSDAVAAGEGFLIPYSESIPAAGLTIGDTSGSREIDFHNPDRSRFDFLCQILSSENRAPVITSAPDTRAVINETYTYALDATDADGDALSYDLVTGPITASIDSAGVLTWNSITTDNGSHDVVVEVTDGRGGSTTQSFTLFAGDALPNRAPVFNNAPLTSIPSGDDYNFTAQATDSDGDTVTYSLDAAPAGMTIDGSTGEINFVAPADGNYPVVLRAADPSGAFSLQSFNLVVGATGPANASPVLAGDFSTTAYVDQLYLEFPTAIDSDGDTLDFTLLTAPAGMTITTTNSDGSGAQARIEFTPTAADLGNHPVVVVVSDDNGGSATRSFTLNVANAPDPVPPTFDSSPNRIATADEAFAYTAVATDPDGDSATIVYSIANAPAGLTIDPATGIVSYTPTVAEIGTADISIIATDSDGLTATQSFTLDIRPTNAAPEITSSPEVTVSAGALYRYDVVALDADDNVTFSLVSAPAEMQITPNSGLIFWQPELADIGDQTITIRATDDRGLFDEQSYTLSVTADETGPVADVYVTDNLLDLGETTRILVRATDDVAIQSLQLSIDGVVVPIDSQNGYTFTPTTAGVPDVVLVAVDTSGNTTIARLDPELRILDPTDTTPPVIEVTSPAPEDIVTYLTDVVGTVTDDNLEFYEIQVSPFGTDNFTTVSRNTFQPGPGGNGITNDILGVFDPTMLANDLYDIRVVAQDISGNVSTLTTPISVEGGAKLGNFRIELTDLAIPLAGIPIQINRVYDTLDSPYNGDFGYGWKLDVASPRIRESVRISESEANGGGIFGATPFRAGTRVYMNAPDGRRVGFTFDPIPEPGFLGTTFKPNFTADPGVYHRLEVEDIPLRQFEDGTFGLFFGNFAYNPDSYTLVTKNQLRYTYDQFQDIELQSIVDRNEVTLDFTENGIFSSTGPSITWTRNDQGQITEILDTAGNALKYTYTTSGDLESFEDQVGNVTSMTYLDEPSHYLESITDPRGIQVLTLAYDENGRLTGQGEALGNSTAQSYDLANNTFASTDLNGNPTTVEIDDRGNITKEIDALGNETTYEYSDSDNPFLETKITNARGFATTYEYDNRGNLTLLGEPGRFTRYQYDAQNNRTKAIGPFEALGDEATARVTEFVYDADGNLIETIDALGNSSFQSVDSFGRITSTTDRRGNTTALEYAQLISSPTRVINPDLTTQQFTYDAIGRPLRRTNELGIVTSTTTYDDAGRVLTSTGADGQLTTNTYDGNLLSSQSIKISDTESQVTTFEYDENGRVLRQIDANSGVIELSYDSQGNVLSVADPVDNVTSYEFDELNRQIVEEDTFGNQTLFVYDEVSNLIEYNDRLGRRIAFVYDAMDRQSSEQWYSADNSLVESQSYSYDIFGNLIAASGSTSVYAYSYDALDRLTSSSNAGTPNIPTVVLSYDYDVDGNRIRVSDDTGVTIDSQYGSRNELLSKTWFGGGVDDARVEFDYNFALQQTATHRYADTVGTALVGRTETDYDDSGRRTRITHLDATDAVLSNYEYDFDFANRITDQVIDDDAVAYTYDPTGQLLTADHSVPSIPDEFYSYDLNGNRTSSHIHGTGYVTGENNQLRSDGDFEYDYDNQGNQIRRINLTTGEITTYEYDHRNRMTRITTTDAAGDVTLASEFIFDIYGRRIAVTNDLDGDGSAGSARENYVYDGENVWADYNESGQTISRYLFGDLIDSNIARWRISEGTGWYLVDHQGSVRIVVHSAGSLVNQTNYDSFGTLVYETGSEFGDRYGFTGRESLESIGLQYNRARHFDSSIGSFVSQDPISFAGNDANLYRYAGNTPINSSDPTGTISAQEYASYSIISFSVGCAIALSARAVVGGKVDFVSESEDLFVNAVFTALASALAAPKNVGPNAVAGLVVAFAFGASTCIND